MSSTNDDLPSIVDQKAVISSALNSTLLFLYAAGVYIGVYAITVRIYSHSHQSGYKHVVIGTLTALFGVMIAQIGYQWYLTNLIFCGQADSRFSLFIASASPPPTSLALSIFSIFLEDIPLILVDGLMVWRCFHACGRSFLLFSLPLGFFFIEFMLIITNIIFGIIYYTMPSFDTMQRSQQSNDIIGGMFVAVALTSLTATFIICHHIYKSTYQDRRSRRRYRHILNILMQSSVIYTAAVLLETVVTIIYAGGSEPPVNLVILANYCDALLTITIGFSPTLMVARLAMGSSDNVSAETCSVGLPSELLGSTDLENNLPVIGRGEETPEAQQNGEMHGNLNGQDLERSEIMEGIKR